MQSLLSSGACLLCARGRVRVRAENSVCVRPTSRIRQDAVADTHRMARSSGVDRRKPSAPVWTSSPGTVFSILSRCVCPFSFRREMFVLRPLSLTPPSLGVVDPGSSGPRT